MARSNEVTLIVEIDAELKRRAKAFVAHNDSSLKKIVEFTLKRFLDEQEGIGETAVISEPEIH